MIKVRIIYGLFFVQQEDGIPQGYLAGTAAELKYLYVLEPYRGRGVATRLVNRYMQYANKDFFVLVEKDDKRALDFYKSLGFYVAGHSERADGSKKHHILKKRVESSNDTG